MFKQSTVLHFTFITEEISTDQGAKVGNSLLGTISRRACRLNISALNLPCQAYLCFTYMYTLKTYNLAFLCHYIEELNLVIYLEVGIVYKEYWATKVYK